MTDQLATPNLKDQSGFSAGFLLGLAVGGAGGYFLSSPHGRSILKNLSPTIKDKLKELENNENVQDLINNLSGLMEAGAEKIEETKEATPPKRFFFSGGSPLKS
jgi:hypothetical protein